MISDEDLKEMFKRVRVCNSRLILDPSYKPDAPPPPPSVPDVWVVERWDHGNPHMYDGQYGPCSINSQWVLAWAMRCNAKAYALDLIERKPWLEAKVKIGPVDPKHLHKEVVVR